MAYIDQNLALSSVTQNLNSSFIYTYVSLDDTLATITTTGYFPSDRLQVPDFINIRSTDAAAICMVSAINPVQLLLIASTDGGGNVVGPTPPTVVNTIVTYDTTTGRVLSKSCTIQAFGDQLTPGAGTLGIAGNLNIENETNLLGPINAVMTNGQLLIGNTVSGFLTKANLTGVNGLFVTNGPGTITLEPRAQFKILSNSPTYQLQASDGGYVNLILSSGQALTTPGAVPGLFDGWTLELQNLDTGGSYTITADAADLINGVGTAITVPDSSLAILRRFTTGAYTLTVQSLPT